MANSKIAGKDLVQLEDFEINIQPQMKQADSDPLPGYPVSITSLAGSTSGILRLDVSDPKFQLNLERVSGIEPNYNLRKEFGEFLFDALFNSTIRDRWSASVIKAWGLRIRMDIQAPELAILPWELMYQEEVGFLSTATNFVLSRYYRVLEKPQQRIKGNIRVLLVAQSPYGLPEIPAEEFDLLKQAIRDIGDSIELTVLENEPISEIHQALEKREPHILHFLGHGIGGSLALTDAKGQLHRIEDEQFAQLLQGRPDIKLVVLNACSSGQHEKGHIFSGVGPALIRKRLPAVVAMQYPAVLTSTAAKFSEKFYAALSNGLPIDLAVNQARNFLTIGKLLDGRDWSTPVLYVGTRNGDMLQRLSDESSVSLQISKPIDGIGSAELIQNILSGVKGLQEWLDLNDKYQRLQLAVNSFADSLKTFHPYLNHSDEALKQIAIEQLDRAWKECARLINELEWIPAQFEYIRPDDKPLSDKKDFVGWISELSQLGADIQDKIDGGSFDDLSSATSVFLRNLERRAQGPLNAMKDEVRHINDLTIQAAARVSIP